jgi:membrane protein YdbS with pleckstrin-like domain
MFERFRQHLLAWLRLPPVPQAPAGAPGSIRVFRAGANYYKLCLLAWAGAQLAALLGIVASLSYAQALKQEVASLRAAEAAGQTLVIEPHPLWRNALNEPVVRFVARGPGWLPTGMLLVEAAAVFAYLLALPVTYAAVRLDYELRWYAVTDRSLRIRTGLINLQELTMSFANLQQVVVAQGPLQRLLGLADVRVQSAGGGGGGEDRRRGKPSESMHAGVFRGVDNATAIRDLILERLRRYREAGLGDPDDARTPVSGASDALAAAREALAEARALRRAATP